MTVALAHTFRIPDEIPAVPDAMPRQFTLAEDPTSEEELSAYEIIECWDALAGLLLRKSLVAGTACGVRRWRQHAEEVAATNAELMTALYQRIQHRAGL